MLLASSKNNHLKTKARCPSLWAGPCELLPKYKCLVITWPTLVCGLFNVIGVPRLE